MLKILLQIVDGVESLHHSNIIHCDLNHNNILIDTKNKNTVKIIDLGISQEYTDRLANQMILGAQ